MVVRKGPEKGGGGGGGVIPDMGNMGMCGPKGYVFFNRFGHK